MAKQRKQPSIVGPSAEVRPAPPVLAAAATGRTSTGLEDEPARPATE